MIYSNEITQTEDMSHLHKKKGWITIELAAGCFEELDEE